MRKSFYIQDFLTYAYLFKSRPCKSRDWFCNYGYLKYESKTCDVRCMCITYMHLPNSTFLWNCHFNRELCSINYLYINLYIYMYIIFNDVKVYTVEPPQITAHYTDVIMTEWASQITSLTIVYSAVYSGGDQRKHQNSASLAFVRGIHRRPGNSPRKGPVTRKMFPLDDVIMYNHE